ncbi:MAG: CRTAC1 family protein [Acidobacteria bacterium]|nr:CRTAC1 family protein [Acidobacteriota bacterium]
MTPSVLIALAFIVAVALPAACGGGASPESRPIPDDSPIPAAATENTGPAGDWFVDRALEAGLRFTHVNGMTGQFYQSEMMAPGVALFDYDNDGDLDVYLAQGETLGGGSAILPPPADQPPGDRLFRNDLAVGPDGVRILRFTDVTDAAGIPSDGYGMGVATGDYDNDGWIDLYLTRFGPNRMLRNQGDGTFADVSAATGTDDPSWGVPATFFDYDRDGLLDLFVGNYLTYTLESHSPCFAPSGPMDYCPPEVSLPRPDVLYRNRGDGTFEDVTAAAGLGREFGPALGATAADFDGDGWLDLFVANDQRENQLWINQQDGTFRNDALIQGAALGSSGEAKADMGVDAGDFDNDGDEDLFITELAGQGSTLYVNGGGSFSDRSAAFGIRAASLPHTGFGVGWIDIDNDGWLDIVAVNGSVVLNLEEYSSDNPFALQQRNQVFRNLGGTRFEVATDRAGAVFTLSEVSRGLAFGDVDNDGDTDLVLANAAGPARLLMNEVGQDRHWIGLRLVAGAPAGGGAAVRDQTGTRVAVTATDGVTRHRRARADGSYASAHDPRLLVGLGDAANPVDVQVIWPNGSVEAWSDVPVDTYTTLTRGDGGPP